MPISLLFWMIFILICFLAVWAHYPFQPAGYRPFGLAFGIMVLIFLLGIGVYGAFLTR